MIPEEISEWISPEIASAGNDAVVLRHDCGVDFQFRVEDFDTEGYLICNEHLKKWRVKLERVVATAGENCFSYNDLRPDPEGVYRHDDGNTMAILFSPGTFLEHNEVAGAPILLLIDERTCILTGADSAEGMAIISDNLDDAIASRAVTIDKKWERWVSV